MPNSLLSLDLPIVCSR